MIIEIRKPQCFSEIGRKDNQEDYLWPLPNTVTRDNRVFLMCDGVGGHDGGEVASETAATAIGSYITENISCSEVFTEENFKEALAYGYDELDKVDTSAVKKMGTTMTCLVLHKGGAMVAHIGDSRIYHIRPSLADKNGRTGIIYQSTDHSLVNDLLRAGELTEEEAAVFPQKNVITRAMQPHLERRYKADIYNIDDVEAGDYFFLCCDGVLERLTNDKLGEILADGSLSDEEKIAAIKSVCDEGTRDNYTCWLIPIDECKSESTDILQEEELVAVVEHDEEVTVQPVMEPKAAVSQTKAQHKSKAGYVKIVPGIILVAVLAFMAGNFFNRPEESETDGKEASIEETVNKAIEDNRGKAYSNPNLEKVENKAQETDSSKQKSMLDEWKKD